jgi:hypothetical protein
MTLFIEINLSKCRERERERGEREILRAGGI